MVKATEELTSAGGLVAEARSLVEDYAKSEIVVLEEPGTGTKALAAVTVGGVIPVFPAVFDAYRDTPLRLSGTATMLALDSLIEHVNRSKDDDSVVFADDSRTAPSITAVYDYHQPSLVGSDGKDTTRDATTGARHGLRRAIFAFPLSDEWKAWTEKNAQAMSMVDFAEFVENRLPDVLFLIPGEDALSEDLARLVDTLGGPDTIATPNKLMELARGLQVNEDSVVQEAVNLASGEGVIRFQTTHTDATGAPLKVPTLFLIAIPVFRNGPLYRIAARLRYRKAGGRLTFWYELWRTDRTFDHAFSEAVERVHVETDLPVLLGRPES